MLKKIVSGLGVSLIATLAYAQDTPSAPPANAPATGRSAIPGGRPPQGGGDSRYLPSQAQWDAMNDTAKAYVAKAHAEAGNDADLKFDVGVFCQATGGATN